MPELTTQVALRRVQSLPFCYLCGKDFSDKAEKTRDHIPPKSIFAPEDRRPTLILPAHLKCNEAQSCYDEIVGQLIAVLHGKHPSPENVRLNVGIVKTDNINGKFTGLVGTNLHNVIHRWLRAFHSALYRQYLPNETKNYLHTPFPSGSVDTQQQVKIEKILPQHSTFVEIIKRNRCAQRLDRIVCCNGKCVYECVWETTDNGEPMCIFALKLYDWCALADTEHFPRRGCVGMYMPVEGRPPNATTTTNLHFPFTNIDILDPFED